MENKDNEVQSGKKGLWAMLKESMYKANSGCGPGCSCNVERQDSESQRKNAPGKSVEGQG